MTIEVPILKDYDIKKGSSFQFIEVDEHQYNSVYFFQIVELLQGYFKAFNREEKRKCLFPLVTKHKNILHEFYGDFVKKHKQLKEDIVEVIENIGIYQRISGFDRTGSPIYQSAYLLFSEHATNEEKLALIRERNSFQYALLYLNKIERENKIYGYVRDSFGLEFQKFLEEPENNWLLSYFGLQINFSRNKKKDIEN